MTEKIRKIKFLKSSKKDYKEVQEYVVKKFSVQDWNKINEEWEEIVNKVAKNPDLGTKIIELEGMGFVDFKKYHHKNCYMVYSWDEENLYIRMFIPSMRDFRTHLMKRLLSQ